MIKRSKNTKKSFDDASCFINRELSWLEFNDRVLRGGLNKSVPLLERLKFFSIVSSNLDEFFMVRVAGLMQQADAGVRKPDPAGLTPTQQLQQIHQRVQRMVSEQAAGIDDVFAQLQSEGLRVVSPDDWSLRQRRFLNTHFTQEIHPLLTPIAVKNGQEAPLLPGLQRHVLIVPEDSNKESGSVVVVPVPPQLPHVITLPSEEGTDLARTEDVIAACAAKILPDQVIASTAIFRITRDADVSIQDDAGSDLLESVEQAILDRRRRRAVRLEVSADCDPAGREWLTTWLGRMDPQAVYPIAAGAAGLDAQAMMKLAGRSGLDHLKNPDWPPQPPADLIGENDLFQAMCERDILLFHPYERFDPVVQLLTQAAEDPNVLAIKQTLYRTSGSSPVVGALERAARNGKQVVVLVELKARFDEFRNIQWARALEDAGCLVIYGVAGYKTHSKALLIVRREEGRLRRYVHLSTGNYNDKTARLYSDIGLLSADRKIAADVAAFFNVITGYSETVGWSDLAIAPTDLRRRFIELIDREIQSSTKDQPGLILVKVNSLQDKEMIQELYRASCAGVQIRLNVRGVCCLRPGVKGLSENIEVVSIIDRYLEHARIFYFRNAGHEEVYLGSADWMTRNLDKRLEILFPVKSPRLRRRLMDTLDIYFADNVKAACLKADGQYEKVANKLPPTRAQEVFYHQAVQAAAAAQPTPIRFQPLRKNA